MSNEKNLKPFEKGVSGNPGFAYAQLLYIEVITIFPIVDVVLKTVNPFYN